MLSLENEWVIRLSILQRWPLDVALKQRAAFTLIPEFSCSERAETKPAVIGCFLCWLCKQRAWLKCERWLSAVPSGRSVASLRAACAEELQSDLLCHPDFGSCNFRFLLRFWKLPFSSPYKGHCVLERTQVFTPNPNRLHADQNSGSGEVALWCVITEGWQICFLACTLLELKANCMLRGLELFPNGKASNEIWHREGKKVGREPMCTNSPLPLKHIYSQANKTWCRLPYNGLQQQPSPWNFYFLFLNVKKMSFLLIPALQHAVWYVWVD